MVVLEIPLTQLLKHCDINTVHYINNNYYTTNTTNNTTK